MAVKNVYPFVKDDPVLKEYLPTDEMDEGRYPNKEWFWGILCTVIPEYANAFIDKVLA